MSEKVSFLQRYASAPVIQKSAASGMNVTLSISVTIGPGGVTSASASDMSTSGARFKGKPVSLKAVQDLLDSLDLK